MISEMKSLEEDGVSLDNLYISDRAHLILPRHKEEEASELSKKIDTTRKGIGYAYRDKVSRCGIRLCDAMQSDEELELIRKYVHNTGNLLNQWIKNGEAILFEGAQGTLLDVDHGTYPFVTSSSPTAGGACTGTGISPAKINNVIGVAKAYVTRVGSGPFPTEMDTKTDEYVRNAGGEYGATTGRPRRCGWLDLFALKYACIINGLSGIALTKMDVLDGFERLYVCTGYEDKGSLLKEFPADISGCRCVYKEVKNWESVSRMREFERMPQEAKDYIKMIEDYTETPVSIVSTGPERYDTIKRSF